MHTLHSNIWKIAASEVLFRFGLINAVYILYFQFLGFTFGDIGLYEAVTSVVIITTELPTGVLADSIGRKRTVFAANAFMLLFALLLGFSSGGAAIIVLAGLFSGLEFSFKSGAQTALLYDTLKVMKREEEFLKISGRINAYALVSGIAGMVGGAFLFGMNPRLPYWLWAVCIGVSLGVLITVREPIKFEKEYSLRTCVNDMKKSILFVFKNKKLLWIAFFFFTAGICAESYWDVFSQAHLKSMGLNPSVFGVIFSLLAGVNALASYYVDEIEEMLGEKKSLYVIVLVEAVIFGVMAYCRRGMLLIVLLIVFTTNRKFADLLEDYYKNRYIPSVNRASVLSAVSFLYNGLFGGFFIIWLFGVSVDGLGGSTTLVLCGLCVLVSGIFLLQLRYSPQYSETLT